MRNCHLLFGLILIVVGATDVSAAGDWYQWAGPNRDFNIQNDGLAESWPENGPPEVWKRELGAGNSAIAVKGGYLYTMFRKLDSEGKPVDTETVVSLRAGDGETIWEFGYISLKLEGQEFYKEDPGPHSTPLVLKDRVYTLGFAGQFHCLDRVTGKLLWGRNLVDDFDADESIFGFVAGPLAYGDLIVIPASGKQCGLVAFDSISGDVVWKSPPASFSYASPFVLKYQRRDYLVHHSRDRVDGIDPKTGKRVWKYEHKKGQYPNVPTPVGLDGGHFMISGQGITGVELIGLTGQGDTIQPVKKWDNQKVWFFYGNAVAFGDYVYGGKEIYYSLNWKTGERGLAVRNLDHANLVIAGELGILLNNKGVLHLIRPEGSDLGVISKFQLFENDAWTIPTIQGTRMYARNRRYIVARELGKPVVAASVTNP